ncbi:MAG: C-type lectin domain protein [Planctomycetaceae bacterium]|nr:C-type lectin domain protein [Planctomycetaceae bacterium]
MSHWKLVVAVVLCCSVSVAAEISEKWQKRINDAEASYTAAVAKADTVRANAVQKANADRLAVLKKALSEATKAKDEDAIEALKEKVAAGDKEKAAKAKPASTTRPENAVRLGTHEYAVIPDKLTWHMAKKRCEELGGHLVTFESPEEQDLALRAGKITNAPLWIGATNEANLTEWTWVNGSSVKVDDFAKLDDTSRETISCGIAYSNENRTWSDSNLGNHFGFICEWDN